MIMNVIFEQDSQKNMCYAYFKYSHWGKEQKDVINIFIKNIKMDDYNVYITNIFCNFSTNHVLSLIISEI